MGTPPTSSKELVPAANGSKGARPRSAVSFPYYALEPSLDVPRAIHEQAGGSCSREQLAPMLGYSGTKNGGFLSRVAASRLFGLVDDTGGMLRLTALANQILSPVHDNDAVRGKIEAFLNVELFSRVYERFKGQSLPSQSGMENLFRTEFKVVPAQVKTALRNLMDSAESAGFFDAAGKGRLVMPLVANQSSPSQAAPQQGAQSPAGSAEQRSPSDQRIGVDVDSIPPAIYGLIRDLPAEGTMMSTAKRQRLIKAFEASINWLYPDAEEEA